MIEAFGRYQAMRGFSPATIRRRRWALEALQQQLGERSLFDATLHDLEAVVCTKTAPATRRAMVCDFRAFYRWAVRHDHTEIDPTARLDNPKVPKRHARPIPVGDLERAIAYAPPRVRMMLLLGSHAGLRVAEIAALHTTDVHLDDALLVVRHGKGAKDRIVPLTPRLADELAACAPGYIIGTTPGAVSEAIRRHFKRLGIRHRPHDLRATFATRAAQRSNGNLRLVASLLGHESVVTTEGYVKWVPDGSAVVATLYDAPPGPIAA